MSQTAQQGQAPFDWQTYFASLATEGAITQEQETDLLRFFRQLQSDGETRITALSAEYTGRAARDSKESANAWLTEQATAMGREHREAIERLLESMGLPLPERGVNELPQHDQEPSDDTEQVASEDKEDDVPATPNLAIERPQDAARRRMRPRPPTRR